MNQFLNYLHSLPDYVIYLTLCLCAILENIFPPFPGDTITAFGAFLVGVGRLNLLFVLISVTVGSLCGFILLFWIGLLLNRRFFIHWDNGIFSYEKIAKAEIWFKKFGYFIILINRFLPGIRSIIAIAAGISRLNLIHTSILALISCVSWNIIWILTGYMLGNNWETIETKVSHILMRYNLSVLILFILLLIFHILKRRYKRE